LTGIILAAGIGRRMWPLTADRPKSLLPLPIDGGCTLVRMVHALELASIDRIVCVVGYLRGEIRLALDALGARVPIELVVNEDYRLGSVCSLHKARDYLDDDVVIADADVLLPGSLVRRLMEDASPNAFLMDSSAVASGEEMMLMVRRGRVLNIGREVPPERWDLLGESLGLLKLERRAARALRASANDIISGGSALGDYELAFRPVLSRFEVSAISVAGEPWIEIDTPFDLMMAGKSVAPRIVEHERSECRPLPSGARSTKER